MDSDIKVPNKYPNAPQDTPPVPESESLEPNEDTGDSVTGESIGDNSNDSNDNADTTDVTLESTGESTSDGDKGDLSSPAGDTQSSADSEKPVEEKSQDNGFPIQPMPTKLPVIEPKRRGRLALIITLIVVLFIAVGAGAYYLIVLNQPKASSENQQATVTVEPQNEEDDGKTEAAKLIDKVKDALKSTPVEITKVNEMDGEAEDGTVVYTLASYQVEGYEFSNGPTTGYGVAVSSPEADKEAIDTDHDAAVKVLEDAGLTNKPDLTANPGDQKAALYASDEVVCYVLTLYALRGNNYTGVGCGDMDSYKEAAEQIKPFHEAFVAENPQLKDTLDGFAPYYGLPQTYDGAEGYKNAEVKMTGVVGLYYQVPKAKAWKYFTGVQEAPLCMQFNTDELKKAFLGRPCSDGTKIVKVSAS